MEKEKPSMESEYLRKNLIVERPESSDKGISIYLITKDADLAFDLLPGVEMDEDRRVFKVELCRLDARLKPAFMVHSYRSFSGLKKILMDSTKQFVIEDQYGTETSPELFIHNMENANTYGESRIPIIENSMFRDLNEGAVYFVDKDGYEFFKYE